MLPNSTRKFSFEWKGEAQFFEFGRYTATAVLVFGTEGRQTVYRETAFWVIPWKGITLTFGGLFLFLAVFTRALRAYVARAIALERSSMAMDRKGVPPPSALSVLVAPIRESAVDLRSASEPSFDRASEDLARPANYSAFFRTYRRSLAMLLIILFGFIGIGWYFSEVLKEERGYEMTVKKQGNIPRSVDK